MSQLYDCPRCGRTLRVGLVCGCPARPQELPTAEQFAATASTRQMWAAFIVALAFAFVCACGGFYCAGYAASQKDLMKRMDKFAEREMQVERMAKSKESANGR